MRYLLFPDEERALYRLLQHELGLRPLGGTNEITDELQNVKSLEADHYFWCPEIGPVKTLGEAPTPHDAKDAVMLQINREADPARWRDRIDVGRTPVIRWSRPRWYRKDRCLVAGRLGAMAAGKKDHPPALLQLHRQIERWLRRPATKFNPFKHCSDLPIQEPANLSVFWVAAWPQAKTWIDQGGELWPWDC